MVVTSIPFGQQAPATTIWPKRPKPITSTLPLHAGEIVRVRSVGLRMAPQNCLGQGRDQRAEQHGGGGDGGEYARLPLVEHVHRGAERNQHEGELAGAGEHRTGA